MTFAEARALFPVFERVAYLNAGTNGPLARPTVEAVEASLERQLQEGRSGHTFHEEAFALRAAVRERIGALLGVEPSLLSITGSTTDGCNIVLSGLGLEQGDDVVTTDSEHFGLLGPLQASPARVVVTEPEADAILAAVTPRTRLIAVSHVLWTTGAVLPVHELREQAGVPILVDGAQSAGAIPVRAAGVDFYTVSAQKWLCAPDGSGALYVADPERLRIARPSYFAQSSYEPDGSFVPRAGAERFDPNWTPVPPLAGLRAALDLVPAWAFDRAAEMAARCRELLAPLVDLVPGGATLVAFRAADPDALVDRLAEAGVVVRAIPGRKLVRVSCGWWTSEDDLQRLAACLRRDGF